jgi:hypothetical protein
MKVIKIEPEDTDHKDHKGHRYSERDEATSKGRFAPQAAVRASAKYCFLLERLVDIASDWTSETPAEGSAAWSSLWFHVSLTEPRAFLPPNSSPVSGGATLPIRGFLP